MKQQFQTDNLIYKIFQASSDANKKKKSFKNCLNNKIQLFALKWNNFKILNRKLEMFHKMPKNVW